MIHKLIKYIKRKRFDLRQAVIDKYGCEFGELYDKLNSGQVIGDFETTVMFLNMIKRVKKDSGLY
jgi:hypothetical protein